MPRPTKKPSEDPDNPAESAIALDKWISLNRATFDKEGTSYAGIEIAVAQSDSYRLKAMYHSHQSLLPGVSRSDAGEHVRISLEYDKRSREWAQQSARMISLRKADLLPKAISVLEKWDRQGDVLSSIEQDSSAPVVPRAT